MYLMVGLDPWVHFGDRREFCFLGFGDGSVKLFDIRTPEAGVATFSDLQSPILDCRLQVLNSCIIIKLSNCTLAYLLFLTISLF